MPEQARGVAKELVVAPVDKRSCEGMPMWPMKYAEAQTQMVNDMELQAVSSGEVSRILGGIGLLGGSSKHLPYCEIKRTNSHRFGCLRLWPKYEDFGVQNVWWADLKWRPLVSFRQHKWRRLFSMASQD